MVSWKSTGHWPRWDVVGEDSKVMPGCRAQLPEGGTILREGNGAKLCQCFHTACFVNLHSNPSF